MPSREELKAKVCQEIDRRSGEIIDIALYLLHNPETGFREVKASHKIYQKLTELGIPCRTGLAITGVKGCVEGGSRGPTVGILGEMDSLIVPEHPNADPQTGAAHACGHHAQVGVMVGVAVALTGSGIMPFLSGRVVFMAVPNEEGVDIEFQNNLRKDGKITFLGGKPELIKLGAFDDIDMAMLSHSISRPEIGKIALGISSNGTLKKIVQFIGKDAHAGAAPHKGINALNGANVALAAINAARETFREEDTIKIHGIITKGGEVVNRVPADVRMELFVRGKNTEAIMDANRKVDRCLKAGALAVGGSVRITTLPGYLPMHHDSNLNALYRSNAVAIVGEGAVGQMEHSTASTDMGDVSHLMPVIQPFGGGAAGTNHTADYIISDYGLAVINPAKVMAMTIIDLLADGATKAKEVLSKSSPPLTREKYVAFMESLLKEEVFQG